MPAVPDAARRTYALLADIPQRGTELGAPNAPVTLQFFGDLQCKESRQVMLGPLPDLIRRFVRPGELRIVYHSTETDTKGAGGWPEFKDQQGAALAAGRQNRLWNFIDVFYREQGPEFTGYVTERFLHLIAVQAGLDMGRWQQSREPSWRWEASLEADGELGKSTHVDSTPSFLVGPTGGPTHVLRHFGLQEPEVFEEAIRATLKEGRASAT
ncbi:MAG: thioredoxin domain-containing protein [Actinobacteria bacterium]|nr:thioredoxin domain-containing protein [Actinomycetota bacterium]